MKLHGLALITPFLVAQCTLAQITIDRTDAVIERKTFDPHHPPADMPKLSPIENAVTQSYFGVEGHVSGPIIDQVQTNSGYQATVRVAAVWMTLRMRVTIWLPANSNVKITNHEEGHRRIAELYYKDADTIARQCAKDILGKTFTSTGATADATADNALLDAYKQAAHQYMDLSDVPCGKAQDYYDQITSHGTNAVKEDKAIQDAMDRVKSTTRDSSPQRDTTNAVQQ